MFSSDKIVLLFVLVNMVLSIQMRVLHSQSKTENDSKRNKEISQDNMVEEVKLIKLAVKLYVYYNELLQENKFVNQKQKNHAQNNFQMVQTKLQNYMNKYKNNKYMMSQAVQEYQTLMNDFMNNQKENPQVSTDEKKPFMWG